MRGILLTMTRSLSVRKSAGAKNRKSMMTEGK